VEHVTNSQMLKLCKNNCSVILIRCQEEKKSWYSNVMREWELKLSTFVFAFLKNSIDQWDTGLWFSGIILP
jgi:hypothetical protein